MSVAKGRTLFCVAIVFLLLTTILVCHGFGFGVVSSPNASPTPSAASVSETSSEGISFGGTFGHLSFYNPSLGTQTTTNSIGSVPAAPTQSSDTGTVPISTVTFLSSPFGMGSSASPLPSISPAPSPNPFGESTVAKMPEDTASQATFQKISFYRPSADSSSVINGENESHYAQVTARSDSSRHPKTISPQNEPDRGAFKYGRVLIASASSPSPSSSK
jgi:hypothetical protein